MRILVVSDSHSGLSYMRLWGHILKPQVIIHLGDYFDDGAAMGEWFPDARLLQVPGNCDRFRCIGTEPEVVFTDIGGVGTLMTHGHLHGVKSGTGKLLASARVAKADMVLFGHTHQAVCYRTEEGLLVMNPGSCGSSGGSVGLIEIEKGQVKEFRILKREDMEEFE